MSSHQPVPNVPEAAAPDYFAQMEELVETGLACVLFSVDSAGVTELHPVETLAGFHSEVNQCTRRGRVLLGAASLSGEGPRTVLCRPLNPEAVQVLTGQYVSHIAALLANDKHRSTHKKKVH